MAEPRRILRLQQLILEVVAVTVQRELQDPRVGMVTITRVRLSLDMSTAQVFWSMLGTDAEKRTTERGLEGGFALIQRRVAQAMGTRVTPTLSLKFDASMEHAQRLNEIFERLRKERGEPPAAEVAEDGAAASAAEDAGADEAEADEDDEGDAEEIPPEDLPRDEDFEEDPE